MESAFQHGCTAGNIQGGIKECCAVQYLRHKFQELRNFAPYYPKNVMYPQLYASTSAGVSELAADEWYD